MPTLENLVYLEAGEPIHAAIVKELEGMATIRESQDFASLGEMRTRIWDQVQTILQEIFPGQIVFRGSREFDANFLVLWDEESNEAVMVDVSPAMFFVKDPQQYKLDHIRVDRIDPDIFERLSRQYEE
jgi:hypothetical protein